MRLRETIALALLLVPGVAAATPWIGLSLGPGTHGGVAILNVVEGSPGRRAGIVAGEEVLSIDGQPFREARELSTAVAAHAVGAKLALRLGGQRGERTVKVVLEERPRASDLQRQVLQGKPAPDFALPVVGGPKLGKLSSLKG